MNSTSSKILRISWVGGQGSDGAQPFWSSISVSSVTGGWPTSSARSETPGSGACAVSITGCSGLVTLRTSRVAGATKEPKKAPVLR